MTLEDRGNGLLLIRYRQAQALAVHAQVAVLERLERKLGKTVLIFDVADEVRSVPIAVPTFWLGITGRPELAISGMGIVTRSIAVRAAAKGFALANVARRVNTTVRTFEAVDEACAWGAELLAP